MANVLIEENTMSAIGNAIRAKTKKTDLIYPADMAEEIDGIVGGIPVEIITRELTEYSNSELEKIGDGAFALFSVLESVDFLNVKTICVNAFYYCTALTTVNFPLATSIGDYAFSECVALTEANFPAATSIGGRAFYDCTALTTVNFPLVTSLGGSTFRYCNALQSINLPLVSTMSTYEFEGCESLVSVSLPKVEQISNYSFRYCYGLEIVDLPVVTDIGSYAFRDTDKLKALILRNPNTVCTLANKNAFTNSSLNYASGGYVYVPSAMVEDYMNATNWSAYDDRFRALEDYTVDGTITGELDETKI